MLGARFAFAAVIAVVAGSAQPAAAEPAFETTVAPAELSYPETTSLDYGLRITTGRAPERLQVTVETASAFPGEGELLVLGAPRLEGPGTLVQGPGFHGDPPACAGSPSTLPIRHGGLVAGTLVEVGLPRDSTSTLVVPASPARDAPWAGMEPRVLFRVPTGPALLSPAPRLTGRLGVRLRLGFGTVSGPTCRARRRFARGRAIPIAGTATPPIPGQVVQLRFVSPGLRAPVTLAGVRAGEDGSFRHAGWRPRLPGDYELGALYRSQSPGLADDFSAPLVFRVGTSPPERDRVSGFDTLPRASPRPSRGLRLSRGVPARRRNLAIVRLACPYLGPRCTGALRLSRRGARLGARRFDVPPGWELDIAVPLSSAARRALLRSELRVVARAADTRGGRRAVRAIRLALVRRR